ncbi:hypothetical protein D3C72_1872660 [compost metagenome]
MLDRLRLDAAQHGRPAAFVLVGVRKLADQVFVAAVAMRHQRRQVALRSRRKVQARRLAGALGKRLLQANHGGIVAHHVVAQRGADHGLQHGGARPGDSVATQIDHGES